MPDYFAITRSNAFPVKSVQAFKEAVSAHGITFGENPNTGFEFVISTRTNTHGQEVVVLSGDYNWPSFTPGAVAGRLGIEFDDKGQPESPLPSAHESLHALVAEHIVDGAVAILMEIGGEPWTYQGGRAVAVNAAGETRCVDLNHIYRLAYEIAGDDWEITYAGF